jgi:hypothetical protein
MKKLRFKPTFWTMVLVLLSLFNYACQDDNIGGVERSEVIPGRPATVHLNVNVDGMGIRTRASIADDEEKSSYCQNLWIGIYNATANENTGKHDLIESFYLTDVASTAEEKGKLYPLTLKTSSVGAAYIVGVANSDVNSGVTEIGEYGKSSESTLRQLLDKASTFEAFKSICALRPDASDVNVYANTLTMSGWYAETQPSVGDEIQPVAINEGETTLTGAIYLSRIISYNKFIIRPGDNISLTLNSWRVGNIPAGCYLLEHAGTDNVGDTYTGDASFFNKSNESRLFTAIKDDSGNTTGHYFEFYQLENKHYATNDISDYNERATNAPDNASYVVVNATVEYYYVPTQDEEGNNIVTKTKPVPKGTPGAIQRTAKVDYTIYLGYCEDVKDDGETAISRAYDFNCRRNTKYTYNATVNGVDNVVVEAKKEGEPEPGTEGWVSDATGDFETLDSHYCEFNICLTKAERQTLRYRITAPYNGKYYYYERNLDGEYTVTDGMDPELYSWIKFYPTSDKNTLAEYNGGKGKNSLGEGTGLWTFDDMCEPTVVDSPYRTDADTDDTEFWYTVFVDEYVYHIGETVIGTDPVNPDIKYYDETSWPKYVNQDNRLAEFIVDVDVSEDGNSKYSYSKYAFAQQSIQTYYKGEPNVTVDNVSRATAIGVEHVEETYCLNMNWQLYTGSFASERTNGHSDDNKYYDYQNGRYNQWYYLENKKSNSWANVIQEKVPGHVNEDESTSFQTSHPAADYPVYMPGNTCGKSANPPSPHDGNAYYANSICMNRNRDLNGNGIIEPNEIRWYLPTSSVYQQIAIAQEELPDPIMKLLEYDKNYFQGRTQERNMTYNFHYVTSDYQYFWAEQAVTTGDFPFDGYGDYNQKLAAAYTVRCVRSLGIVPSQTPVFGEVEAGYAFVHNAKDRTFTQNNFTDETLRGYNLGGLAPHTLADPSSRPYKKFEYAENVCTGISGNELSVNSSGTLSWGSISTGDLNAMTAAWNRSLEKNDICGQYTQDEDGMDVGEWRVPSICEMSLMWIENIPQKDNCYALSSTHDYFITFALMDKTTDNQAFLGYNNWGDRHVIALDILNGGNAGPNSIKIRCVRDVK